MAKKKTTIATPQEKLTALYKLQTVDYELDQIYTIRGELPQEVSDLEDEIVGLNTRIQKTESEIEGVNSFIEDKVNLIKVSKDKIVDYNEKLKNVRNNREYNAITQELEYQELEIQLAEKLIKEANEKVTKLKEQIQVSQVVIDERNQDLERKQKELDSIVTETEKEEKKLLKEQAKSEKVIDERLLKAYKRLRSNLVNKLAVVKIDRDACGGCFAKIPPQRQMDIKLHKKIIVCEHCGRILIDESISDEVHQS